jgi:hypothetical protein
LLFDVVPHESGGDCFSRAVTPLLVVSQNSASGMTAPELFLIVIAVPVALLIAKTLKPLRQHRKKS